MKATVPLKLGDVICTGTLAMAPAYNAGGEPIVIEMDGVPKLMPIDCVLGELVPALADRVNE